MLEPLWTLLDRWLFSASSQKAGPLPLLLRALRYPYAVLRDLSRGQINLHAMGLVYTTLLSLIPLIAFSFAILKLFGAHRELEPVILEFFRPLGAEASAITANIMEFADSVSSGLVGSIGLALLLWTLIGTIQKVETSFNYLWRVQQQRGFGRRIAEYLSLIIIGPLLLVGFVTLAHAAVDSDSAQQLASLPIIDRLWALGVSLAPYAMVSSIFTLMYLYVPNTRVLFLPALVGGLVAGVLWAAVGKIFTELVVYTTRLTLVYAGFAVVVAALLWTYLGWLILLIGAQLSFYLQNHNYLRLGLVELKLSNTEREHLGLRMMYLIALAHSDGSRRWTVGGIATRLGLPAVGVAEIASALEAAGLVSQNDRGELLPGRDTEQIRLVDILDVVRSQRSGHTAPREAHLPAVDGVIADLAASWRENLGARTLRDLIT
jgi:membrane protein